MATIRHKQLAALALTIGLSATGVAVAQGPGGGGSGQQREQQGQPGQPAGHGEQQLGRDRDVDRTHDQDRDRTQDQLHLMDQQQLRDQDIYGSALMSTAEREQYRQRLQTVQTDNEWARARARTQNTSIDPPIYGQHMMTTQEQARYREQLRSAQDEQARISVRARHEEAIRTRARELGLAAPQRLYGQQLMTEQEQERLRERPGEDGKRWKTKRSANELLHCQNGGRYLRRSRR
jgi:hypothetical protein